ASQAQAAPGAAADPGTAADAHTHTHTRAGARSEFADQSHAETDRRQALSVGAGVRHGGPAARRRSPAAGEWGGSLHGAAGIAHGSTSSVAWIIDPIGRRCEAGLSDG